MAKKKVKLSSPAGALAKETAFGNPGEVPGWVCPHCNEMKPIEDFGFRQIKPDVHIKQSWCKKCRSE